MTELFTHILKSILGSDKDKKINEAIDMLLKTFTPRTGYPKLYSCYAKNIIIENIEEYITIDITDNNYLLIVHNTDNTQTINSAIGIFELLECLEKRYYEIVKPIYSENNL